MMEGAQPLKRQVLSGQVSEVILQGLMDGQLRPGDRLVEKDIADLLGVSRSPIREALTELAQLGVTVREPGRGSRIREWSRRDLEEMFGVREVLEGFAARLAARNLTPAARKPFEKVISRMRSTAARGDHMGIVELDLTFHQLMWDLSRNDLLRRTLTSLSHQFRVFLTLNWRFHGGLDTVSDNHMRLLEALDTGDDEVVSRAIREHVFVEKMIASFPSEAERPTK
jgi:DNA-binding GntR family transcriptional regulator